MRGERGEGDCKGMNMWNKSSHGFKPNAKVMGGIEIPGAIEIRGLTAGTLGLR